MNWIKLTIRAARLGPRKYGRHQFAAESFIYSAIPVNLYDIIDITFKEDKDLVILKTEELTIEIDCAFEIHKLTFSTGKDKSYTNLEDIIQTVREYYIKNGKKVRFALN